MMMLALVLFVLSCASLLLHIWGTILTRGHFKQQPKHMDAAFGLLPVSIIKPIKGIDPDLKKNLMSFFNINYSNYEIIFAATQEDDPAIQIVMEVMSQYPNFDAKLVVADRAECKNPKVKNLISGFSVAKYDWVLISDSNIQVGPAYLKRMMAHVENDTGIITAIVSGQNPTNYVAEMEALFLNTFYSRWMKLASWFGYPIVLGKSMLLRKSAIERVGGIEIFSNLIAEDYMAGEAMRMLGLKVQLMTDAVVQNLGDISLTAFLDRHIRWGKIRKSQLPLAFFGEILMNPIFAGLLFLIALMIWQLPALLGFSVFLCMAFVSDLSLNLIFDHSGRSPLRLAKLWFVRELLQIYIWFIALLGQKVKWRGAEYRLLPGGLIE